MRWISTKEPRKSCCGGFSEAVAAYHGWAAVAEWSWSTGTEFRRNCPRRCAHKLHVKHIKCPWALPGDSTKANPPHILTLWAHAVTLECFLVQMWPWIYKNPLFHVKRHGGRWKSLGKSWGTPSLHRWAFFNDLDMRRLLLRACYYF